MRQRPRISVVTPYHNTDRTSFFLSRLLSSLDVQTFRDFEVILTNDGLMAENTNSGIRKATGELVKILYMDDYLAHSNALQEISDNFTEETQWLVTGCLHYQEGWSQPQNYHAPNYNADIHTGVNTVGSPSVLTFRREGCLFFDERLSYLLDCELYKRLHDTYGPPTILNTPNVIIGIHPSQTSNIMPTQEKQEEYQYVMEKYHG